MAEPDAELLGILMAEFERAEALVPNAAAWRTGELLQPHLTARDAKVREECDETIAKLQVDLDKARHDLVDYEGLAPLEMAARVCDSEQGAHEANISLATSDKRRLSNTSAAWAAGQCAMKIRALIPPQEKPDG